MTTSRFGGLPTRVAVAAVAIPTIIWVTMEGGYLFFAFVSLISGLSLYEFYRLAEQKGAFPLKTAGLLAGFVVNGSFVYERLQVDMFSYFEARGIQLSMFSQLQFLLVVLLLFILVVLLIGLLRQKGSPTLNLGTTVLGVVFISLFYGTLISTRELFPTDFLPTNSFPQVSPMKVNSRPSRDGVATRSFRSWPRFGSAIPLRTSSVSPLAGTGCSSA